MELATKTDNGTETKTDNRTERRRRIMSREMDRMAVITGRLRNLPPSPPPSPSSPAPAPFLYHQTHQRGHSHTGISPSFFSKEFYTNPDSIPLPNIQAIPKPREVKATPLLKHMSINETREEKIAAMWYHQLNYQKLDPIGEVHTELVSSPSAKSMVQKASIDNDILFKTQPLKPRLFTSKRLNTSILASQTTRVFCSLLIASFAILSHVNHLLRNTVTSESTVASKPLYILLLTNTTIVVARMLAERQKDNSGEAEEDQTEKMKEDGHNWDSAVKVLERGLVFYQAFRAFFIDFSVYAVVVICGISFL